MKELRIFSQDVIETTGISPMELPLICAKMHRMKLRPTLVDCMIALKNKEVDPNTIIEAIKEDARPNKKEKELEDPQDQVE
tara:strand:+ start:202 stop:444 length:243 start_codon:yes stop_codon:yes gene_type:complete